MGSDLELQIEELRQKGFVRSSSELSQYFGQHPDLRTGIAHFRSGFVFSPTSRKPSTFDLFGSPGISYYYSIEQKESFERHLEEMFCIRNPSPSTTLIQAFGRILHEYDLHWSRCRHKIRPIGTKGVPRGTKRPQYLITAGDLQRLRELTDH